MRSAIAAASGGSISKLTQLPVTNGA